VKKQKEDFTDKMETKEAKEQKMEMQRKEIEQINENYKKSVYPQLGLFYSKPEISYFIGEVLIKNFDYFKPQIDEIQNLVWTLGYHNSLNRKFALKKYKLTTREQLDKLLEIKKKLDKDEERWYSIFGKHAVYIIKNVVTNGDISPSHLLKWALNDDEK
jgi:hypothetical protein